MAGRKVLVTGGAGFIGSHVADAYIARGDRVWVLDDLSTGREANVPKQAEFVNLSITDPGVADLFQKVGGFDVVNHHAAQIDVRKSVADPRLDADINLGGLLTLLEACRATGVKRSCSFHRVAWSTARPKCGRRRRPRRSSRCRRTG